MTGRTMKSLDGLIYVISFLGVGVSAFSGSLIWTCAFGFLLIDEALTIALLWGKEDKHE